MADPSNAYNSIIIVPPPESSDMTIQVEGLFYSDELVNDIDQNFWSTNHPLTLVHAALMLLEETYRNTEGAKDWNNAIDGVLTPMNMDIIEEEIDSINQMEG